MSTLEQLSNTYQFPNFSPREEICEELDEPNDFPLNFF